MIALIINLSLIALLDERLQSAASVWLKTFYIHSIYFLRTINKVDSVCDAIFSQSKMAHFKFKF